MNNRMILDRITPCAYGNKDHAVEMQKIWQRIVAQVDISTFLVDHRDKITCKGYDEDKCPFDNVKHHFSVSKENKLFHCWECGKRGDIISLCSKILRMPLIDVAYYLVEKYHINLEGLL